MEKIKLYFSYPNSEGFLFLAYDFILENEDEILLLGYDTHHNQLTVLGVLEDINDDNVFYYYHIKQVKQEKYKKIIDAKMDTIHKLKSNIDTGFWVDSEFIKKSGIPPKLKYFLGEGTPEIVQKGPFTHREGGIYMISTHDGFYQKRELKKAI
jgi:hypothetical protein